MTGRINPTWSLFNSQGGFELRTLGSQACHSNHQANTKHRNEPPVYNNVKGLMVAYPQQFDHIGKFRTTHWLVVDLNIPPHVDPPRGTTIALKNKIQSELDDMLRRGVIRRIQEPTEWVSSLTDVTKKRWQYPNLFGPKASSWCLDSSITTKYRHWNCSITNLQK